MVSVINSGNHSDIRGEVRFFNDFDMSQVKRFYIINNRSKEIFRAWQGHKNESKWFVAIAGDIKVAIVKVENWEKPSKDLIVSNFVLSSKNYQVLYVPGGHATGIRSLTEGASLMVFSDKSLDESHGDDYRYNSNTWKA